MKLEDLQREANQAIIARVEEINSYARNAALNEQIFKFENVGRPANDLQDRRNLIVDNLSRIIRYRCMRIPAAGSGWILQDKRWSTIQIFMSWMLYQKRQCKRIALPQEQPCGCG